ncbi:hypothetical protein [Caldovatus aquaticus]|uniref:Uncharacterized protein n=1 Tax=Caldovatus aquaticus TaxID=2865671 RepID=A0ABS7EXX6_9PROT|nr:hypothetical protein [Caldovatus aquaticus]MBW8268084.1 hypothetical protein [Caldovatus aquaticus]
MRWSPMRRLMTVAALAGAVLAAGCTDPYGRVDPARTALLGAGIGAAAGLAGGAIAAENQRRSYYGYYGGPAYYPPPPPRYYYPRPRYYYYYYGY